MAIISGLFFAAALLLLAGCGTFGPTSVDLSLPYKPDNVYLADARLPSDLKRVAVLPMACDDRQTDLASGRETLQPVLIAELIKTKKFEVIEVKPEELWRLTGCQVWTSWEELPAGFLEALQKEYGCDAVMFCELTEYHAYPPLAVGWRLKLVDVRHRNTIWSGDENFDAGKPAVVLATRRYEHMDKWQIDSETADWLAMNSPSRFGQYSIANLLDTLPAR